MTTTTDLPMVQPTYDSQLSSQPSYSSSSSSSYSSSSSDGTTTTTYRNSTLQFHLETTPIPQEQQLVHSFSTQLGVNVVRMTCIVTCAISCSISLLIQYYGLNLVIYAIFKTISASCFLMLALYNWKGYPKTTSITSSLSSKTTDTYSLVREQFGLIVVVGQAFSLVGDVLLVWCEIHDIFFLSGGLFFALAHICYMLSYLTLLSYKKFKLIDWSWLIGMSIFVSCMTWYCIVRGILQYIHSNTVMSTFIWIYAVMISMMVALSPAGDNLTAETNATSSSSSIGTAAATTTNTSSTTMFYDHVKALDGHQTEQNLKTKQQATTWNSKFIYRTLGSVVFYLSDLCVARQKFMVDEFVNVAVGLPLYFIAQLLIASSI